MADGVKTTGTLREVLLLLGFVLIVVAGVVTVLIPELTSERSAGDDDGAETSAVDAGVAPVR